MPASFALTPAYFLIFGFLCGITGFRLGWRIGSRIALPLIQGAFGWVAFLLAWSTVGPCWAAASVGSWALGTAVSSITTFYGRPGETDARVIRAAPYRASMLLWIESGRLEGRAPETVMRHLREAVWYTAAAVATANLGSIAMGAVLLNYMNAYVATLLRAAKRGTTVLLLGWNVWSVVRVAAYVLIGAAASAPVLRLSGWRVDASAVSVLAIAGAVALVGDLVLKLALSRRCAHALASAIDLAAAKANRP